MNVKEKIIVTSEILNSALDEDDVSLNAQFYICDFLPNENGVMLNRKTIDNWISTLINQPVLGKIGINDDGTADFEGHNMQKINRVDNNGNIYQTTSFDTSAIGTFTNVTIESIGGKDCITATAKIWKRFPEVCAVISKRLNEGILNTSWEIAVKKSHYEMINNKKIKIIDDGVFIGHTLLNAHFPPAYKDSQLLAVASKEENSDNDLIDALTKDLSIEKSSNKINNVKGDEILKDKTEISETDKELDVTNNDKETAALTEYDLRQALRQAIADKLKKDKWDFYVVYNFPTDGVIWIQMWDSASELDVLQFTYTVENDIVTVSDPVAAKLTVSVSQINSTIAELNSKIEEQTNALLKANEEIQTLNTTVSELTPFKDSFEKVEQERIEKETSEKRNNLKAYALKSGFITDEEIESSEDIKSYIEQVNEKEIRAIIAERFMNSLDKKSVETSSIETSEKKEDVEKTQAQAKINVTEDSSEDIVDKKAIMKKFLHK